MRSFTVLVLLAFSGISGVSAQPGENLHVQLQSEELRQVYSANSTDLAQLIESEEAREQMLQQALFYAGQGAPVDNRTYLFALAVDLYHSLPPGEDPTGYEPGELGGKGEWLRRFRNWPGWGDYSRIETPLETDPESDWEAMILAHEGEEQFDNLIAAIEIKYIRHYFQENIELDDFIQHARFNAADLSFSSPTHYAALRAYLDVMKDRIRSGIPPWEDATESQVVDTGSKPANAPRESPLISAPPTVTDEFAVAFEPPPQEKASGLSSLTKVAIGALLIVVIVTLLIKFERRRR